MDRNGVYFDQALDIEVGMLELSILYFHPREVVVAESLSGIGVNWLATLDGYGLGVNLLFSLRLWLDLTGC